MDDTASAVHSRGGETMALETSALLPLGGRQLPLKHQLWKAVRKK